MDLGKIFLSIFIQKVKVTPLNQFRELQILRLIFCQIFCIGTAGTVIQILGSCSAHPLPILLFKQQQEMEQICICLSRSGGSFPQPKN